jgi:hypothetical protein
MKVVFSAVLAAASIAFFAKADASAAPATDAMMRSPAGNSYVEFVHHERRAARPRSRREQNAALENTAPNRGWGGGGPIHYQDGAYTYTIGPDGRRWYDPTPNVGGPQ